MSEIVNLNKATTEKLQGLPGIGPAMADRIIANRPYKKVEDLLNVNGVGPVYLERLRSQVEVSGVDDDLEDEEVIYLGSKTETALEDQGTEGTPSVIESMEEEKALPSWDGSSSDEEVALKAKDQTATIMEDIDKGEKTQETISKEKAIVPIVKKASSQKRIEEKTRSITWGKVLLLIAASNFVTLVLAVLLTLGILGSLNNGLSYGSRDQAQEISHQIDAINSKLSLFNEDVEGLRLRLDNLESLSGRVGEIEIIADQLSKDVATIAEENQGIKDQMAEFMDSAERFQTFIAGLGDLLDTLNEGLTEVP